MTYELFLFTGTIQQQASIYLSSKHMFHAARYSDSLLSQLGGDFSKVGVTKEKHMLDLDYKTKVYQQSMYIQKIRYDR